MILQQKILSKFEEILTKIDFANENFVEKCEKDV